ncbi:diguanylate cyclase [Candidatus Aerophobetes bacterium]|nr:diguanylate cyclase [Candidatus Aerophobetes bacterium]
MDSKENKQENDNRNKIGDELIQGKQNLYRHIRLEKVGDFYNTRIQDVQLLTLSEAWGKLEARDHLCFIYESAKEWRSAIIPFLKIGLKKGEKCIYIVDTHTADELRTYLCQENVDVNKFEASGQLLILHQKDSYTKGGSFDPGRMVSLLIDETKKAIKSGYSALRITGEMSWAIHGNPGSEKLIEYEVKLNKDFFPKYPCLVICQYDKRKFPPEIMKAVIMTHPLLVLDGRIYSNFYYISPEKFLSKERAKYELEHWLNNIKQEAERDVQLAYMVTHDPLTDLPNRLLFNDRLHLAIAHAERRQEKLAVMMLDLDNFKEVNDRLGHRMGDRLLQSIANRLKGFLRKSDTVARVGGDEFLIILSDIKKEEDAVKSAQKILKTFTEPFEIREHRFNITTSVGFSIYPTDSKDADTLLRYADIAMYQVKRRGRNNYQRYDPALNTILE